jgi:hypothetical protein
MGIVAPGVTSVQDVQALICAAKYPPAGSRGFAMTRTSAFGHEPFAADTAEYFNTCNRETLVIPQCETKQALDQIDAIAALDGWMRSSLGLMTFRFLSAFRATSDAISCKKRSNGSSRPDTTPAKRYLSSARIRSAGASYSRGH